MLKLDTKYKNSTYFTRLVFFLLKGPIILNISSTTPFLPKDMALTAVSTSGKHDQYKSCIGYKTQTNSRSVSKVNMKNYVQCIFNGDSGTNW